MFDIEVTGILSDIEYGYIDLNKEIHYGDLSKFHTDFRLRSVENILKTKIGTCWCQTEAERYLFRHYPVKTYYYESEGETHTFLVLYHNKKYYWIEHAWEEYKAIHIFNDLHSLLYTVREVLDIEKHKGYVYTEYKKPEINLNCDEFMKYCRNGIKVNV